MTLNNKYESRAAKRFLFDTSVIVALLKEEPGYKIVEDALATGAMSSVNLCELVSILARSNIVKEEIDDIITDLVPKIITFDSAIAIETGKLIEYTKQYGLSLGDRACLATAIYYGMPVYTTDKIWQKLDIPELNIILIR